jgi:hypothetical protein
MFYAHKWNQEEINRCYREAYCQDCQEGQDPSRFTGLLLPFIGGLIVGGLFIPKINNQPQNYPMYYPPYPYPNNYIPYQYTNTN